MTKENKNEDCSEFFISIIEGQKETVKLFKDIVKIIDTISSVTIQLQKAVSVIIFLVFILIYKVFISEIINNIFENIFQAWKNIPESYHILILSLMGGIPAAIISHIIASILFEKIKDALQKTKDTIKK
ncbi:TPA: hypothetical protein DIC62_00280 [Candidatus Nomurabacteria bacterium]|nr:hypothetical protein [Candidatus Nomurabacteria bacterium]